jgi:hypothetical protein
MAQSGPCFPGSPGFYGGSDCDWLLAASDPIRFNRLLPILHQGGAFARFFLWLLAAGVLPPLIAMIVLVRRGWAKRRRVIDAVPNDAESGN